MSNSNLIDLGLGKVCRACLSDEGEMKSVFSSSSDSSEIQIFKMFECCASLEIRENDDLPGVICIHCELRLISAFNFRELCQRSNITLRKYIENAMRYNVKHETPTEEKFFIEPSEVVENRSINGIDEPINADADVEDEKSDNDEPNTEDSNDYNDDTLLISQRESKIKCSQFTEEVVNQAIAETKKKYSERRECTVCGFISSNARGLSLHISHLHKDLKEKWCNVCLEEVDNLASHIKEHNKVRSYSCTFCEKTFSSQGHLTEHIRSHSMERPFKCKECNKGFLSSRHLKVHERIHSGEKPFSCPHCLRRFTQKGSLQGHIRTHTGFKPFRCEVCSKQCTTSSALALHRAKTGHNSFYKLDNPEEEQEIPADKNVNEESIKLENNTNNETDPLKMDIEKSSCPKIENNEKPKKQNDSPVDDNIEDDSIKVELSAQTSSLDPLAICKDRKLCTVCGKTFSTASKLRLHMRVHTGETPYKCQYCAKRFSTRSQLVVHVRTHTGERPHVCHVCGKGFAQSSVLNTHMKLHTGRPEQCTVCQQRFCRPAELRLHMRKHTGEKPYLCTECGQAFIQRSHLMEHVKIHSDERPYKCHLCDRAFKQSSSLKSHIQIHTGYKPYKCSQCPYACRQPYSLTQHMKQHSQDSPQAHRPHVCLICHKTFTTMAMLTSHSRSIHQAIF